MSGSAIGQKNQSGYYLNDTGTQLGCGNIPCTQSSASGAVKSFLEAHNLCSNQQHPFYAFGFYQSGYRYAINGMNTDKGSAIRRTKIVDVEGGDNVCFGDKSSQKTPKIMAAAITSILTKSVDEINALKSSVKPEELMHIVRMAARHVQDPNLLILFLDKLGFSKEFKVAVFAHRHLQDGRYGNSIENVKQKDAFYWNAISWKDINKQALEESWKQLHNMPSTGIDEQSAEPFHLYWACYHATETENKQTEVLTFSGYSKKEIDGWWANFKKTLGAW